MQKIPKKQNQKNPITNKQIQQGVRYKVNTQKFIAFLYTNHVKFGFEIKNTIQWPKPRTLATSKAREGVEPQGLLFITSRN